MIQPESTTPETKNHCPIRKREKNPEKTTNQKSQTHLDLPICSSNMQGREPIIHRCMVYKTCISLYQSFRSLQVPNLSCTKEAMLLGGSTAQALTHLNAQIRRISLSCASARSGRALSGRGENGFMLGVGWELEVFFFPLSCPPALTVGGGIRILSKVTFNS